MVSNKRTEQTTPSLYMPSPFKLLPFAVTGESLRLLLISEPAFKLEILNIFPCKLLYSLPAEVLINLRNTKAHEKTDKCVV